VLECISFLNNYTCSKQQIRSCSTGKNLCSETQYWN